MKIYSLFKYFIFLVPFICIAIAISISINISFIIFVSLLLFCFIFWNFEIQEENIELSKNYSKLVDRYNDASIKNTRVVEWLSGYPDQIPLDLKEDLSKRGVASSTSHVLNNLIETMTSNDTIIVVHANQKDGKYYTHIAGKPMHIDVADWIMKGSHKKIRDLASPEFVIWKKFGDGEIN